MKLVYTKDMTDHDIYDYDLIYNGEVLVFIARENSVHYTYPKQLHAFYIDKDREITVDYGYFIGEEVLAISSFNDKDLLVCFKSTLILASCGINCIDFP